MPKRSLIPVPGYDGLVNIGGYEPIIDTPEFQALDDKYQLGASRVVYKSAVHKRSEHCLGTFYLTHVTANRLAGEDMIDKGVVRYLEAAALLHDITHGPFSHVIEALVDNHKTRLEPTIRGMGSAIEECGLDTEKVLHILLRNPKKSIISDKTLGTDKLDYLYRDALETGFASVNNPLALSEFMIFRDGKYGLPTSRIDDAVRIQNLYFDLHTEIYLGRQSLMAQRQLERAVGDMLEKGVMTKEQLLKMTDSGLLALFDATDCVGGKLGRRYKNHNTLYKTAVSARMGRHAKEENSNKPIHVSDISKEEMTAIAEKYGKHSTILGLEKSLEGLLGLGEGEVIVTTPAYFARLDLSDCILYNGREWLSLFEVRPKHREALLEKRESHSAVRIGVQPENREYVAKRGQEVINFIRSQV